ncbi:hypothetical protein PVK06_044242 [Gossypium arboreum]|uniref:Protein RADIALIS-like 3 n=1 Tax=Gossypium arboreum TaxID=29729 RepID=A0ABR0MR59_GOSAR|nr:hypothetical protein PVK06_044242 [Gossypium arboreum]
MNIFRISRENLIPTLKETKNHMDNFPKTLCECSWEENKLFELALAVLVDARHLDHWQVVAAMVGGEKTTQDVHTHYVKLLEDL